MLQPPEWRIETRREFDREFAHLSEANPRLVHLRHAWDFYLLRQPIRFSTGLTREDDDWRVFATTDNREGIEYVVGLEVDTRRQIVCCRWIEGRDMLAD